MDLAKTYHEELLKTIDSPGFKIFMQQMDREIRRAEIEVLCVGSSPNFTAEQVTMQLRDAQGFLRGLKHMRAIPEELLEALAAGHIPGEGGKQKWPGE